MMMMTTANNTSTASTTMIAKELEFATLLGLVLEPTANKIALTPALTEQLQELTMVLQVSQHQLVKPLCADAWIDLLPWHSFN
jgi:hypothetical protein